MDFYIKIDARAADEFSIRATGRDREICGKLEDHLILNTYREVLEANHFEAKPRAISPLALRIANDIPIGKGCGSSAAARLAGIALAVHFGGLHWTDAQIIGEASRREHHPDNASACWMGGLTVARMSGPTEDDAEAQVVCIRPKGKWPLLLAVPSESLATEEGTSRTARTIFASRRGHQRAEFHAAAGRVHQGRPDLLSAALEDRIHQPYRAALCPLLPCLQELTGKKWDCWARP